MAEEAVKRPATISFSLSLASPASGSNEEQALRAVFEQDVASCVACHLWRVKVVEVKQDGEFGTHTLLRLSILPAPIRKDGSREPGAAPGRIRDGLWEQLLNAGSPLYTGRMSQHVDVGRSA